MKNTFATPALFKRIDVAFQCFTFILMVLLIRVERIGPFGLYIMAAGQCLSALAWHIYFSKETVTQYRAGKRIRTTFLLLAAFLIIVQAASMTLFTLVSLCLLFLGPLLGLAYFIITCLEIRFYTRARKPYYLL